MITYQELENHLKDTFAKEHGEGLGVRLVEYNRIEGGIVVELSYGGYKTTSEFDNDDFEPLEDTEDLFEWLVHKSLDLTEA